MQQRWIHTISASGQDCRCLRDEGKGEEAFPGPWRVLRRRHCRLQLRGRLLDRAFRIADPPERGAP